jgi:hypothetical protein
MALEYPGDARSGASSTSVRFAVAKVPSRVQASVAATVPFNGGSLSVDVAALDSAPVSSAVAMAGKVVVSENESPRQRVVLDGDGRAVLSLAGLAAGTHTLDLDYLGDELTDPSSTSTTFTVGQVSKAATVTLRRHRAMSRELVRGW